MLRAAFLQLLVARCGRRVVPVSASEVNCDCVRGKL